MMGDIIQEWFLYLQMNLKNLNRNLKNIITKILKMLKNLVENTCHQTAIFIEHQVFVVKVKRNSK